MTDLYTLRPEVQKSSDFMDTHTVWTAEWKIIRAELLRLAGIESEFAALKARVAEAPTAQLIDQGRAVQQWCVRATDGSLLALPPALSGKRVRLVVEE